MHRLFVSFYEALSRRYLITALALLLALFSTSAAALTVFSRDTMAALDLTRFPTPQQVIDSVPGNDLEAEVRRIYLLQGLFDIVNDAHMKIGAMKKVGNSVRLVSPVDDMSLPPGMKSWREWGQVANSRSERLLKTYSSEQIRAEQDRLGFWGENFMSRRQEAAMQAFLPDLWAIEEEARGEQMVAIVKQVAWAAAVLVCIFVLVTILVRAGMRSGLFQSPWFWAAVFGIPTGVGAFMVMGPGLSTLVAIVLAIGVGLIVRRIKRNDIVRAEHARIRRDEERRWAALGDTPEARDRAINDFFDAARGVVTFEARLDWEEEETKDRLGHKAVTFKARTDRFGPNWVQFRVESNLATMIEERREWLRALELMKNWDLLGDLDYPALKTGLLCLPFPEKPDSPVNYEIGYSKLFLKGGIGVEDHSGQDIDAAIASYYTGRCSGRSMNREAMMNQLEKLLVQPDCPAAAKKIRSRLGSGGGWLSEHEVDGSVFRKQSDWELKLGYIDGTDRLLTFSGEGAMLSVAPPGSGKTQCNVFPNLLSWRGAAVVLDIKGEIYDGTSKWRAENVGPVYRFSPLDPDNSHCYNPLAFIDRSPDNVWEESRFMADMMIVPSGGNADPFWENKAKEFLTAAIAAVCFYNEADKRPMHKLMELVNGMHWGQFIGALKQAEQVRPMVMAGHSLGDIPEKTRQSMMQVTQSSLSAWVGSRIERATARSDWSPLDLRNGTNPTIYICLKPNEVEAYISLLRIFIAQHIRMLTNELPPRDAAPILFMLDELPRLRHMPPVEEAIEVGRQYGLRLWMFVQSLGQLEKAYPNAQGMIGSCAVRVFMNPSTADGSADQVAAELGHLGATVGDRPVSGTDLARPEFRDYQIVLAGSNKPVKVAKAFTYQDPELTARMGRLENLQKAG